MDKLKLSHYQQICRLCLSEKGEPDLVEITNNPVILKTVVQRVGLNLSKDLHLPQQICNECLDKIYQMELLVLEWTQSDQKIRLHYGIHRNDDATSTPTFEQIEENAFHLDESIEFEDEIAFAEYEALSDDSRLIVDEPEMITENGAAANITCKRRSSSMEEETDIKQSKFNEVDADEMKRVNDLLICKICDDNSSNSITRYTEHLKLKHNIDIYLCTLCGLEFKCGDSLEKHEAEKHINNFACRICIYITTSRHALQNHFKTHMATKAFKCNICNKTFRFNKYLMSHLASHEA